MLQSRGCAQIAGDFKGFPKFINFLFFELFVIEKMGFEWLCVFIEPSGTTKNDKIKRVIKIRSKDRLVSRTKNEKTVKLL